MSVGKYLKHGNFNNPIAANINSGGFQIENDKWFGKIKLHDFRIYSEIKSSNGEIIDYFGVKIKKPANKSQPVLICFSVSKLNQNFQVDYD